MKRVEHKRSFPGYLGNRTLNAKLAKIKKNLNEKKFGKVNKSTKNNLKSSGSSIRRLSSDSDQGSNVPIPIHFKCGIIEYTKIAYRLIFVRCFSFCRTWGEHVVYRNCSECKNNLCTHVLPMFWARNFHVGIELVIQRTICRYIVGYLMQK